MKPEDVIAFNKLALHFFSWLHESEEAAPEREFLSKGVTRDLAGQLFQRFLGSCVITQKKKGEGKVMAALRQLKKMRSKRYDDQVICVFANADGKTFAPIEERQTARKELKNQRLKLTYNKGGIEIRDDPIVFVKGQQQPITAIFPMNEDVSLSYPMKYGVGYRLELSSIQVGGPHKHDFRLNTKVPMFLEKKPGIQVRFSFRTSRIAAHRASFIFCFRRKREQGSSGPEYEDIRILRDILLRSGDPKLYDILEVKKPYVKKKKWDNEKPVNPKDVVHPPKEKRRGGYKGLAPFRIPKGTLNKIESDEMEDALVKPWDYDAEESKYDQDEVYNGDDFGTVYADFWQNLVWASECQAYDDIRFFDMEDVKLMRHGRLFKLYVSGLAEGRPSVLRGDIVICKWNGKEYRGRVVTVEQLDVLLEFHKSFHQAFDVGVDRVERVRFTFSRTNFRTAHAGILEAGKTMGPKMLVPSKATVQNLPRTETRTLPPQWRWTSNQLNREQQTAVMQIVYGEFRPMPYVIFGPPGTGKTTTLVESIYQLAKLKDHDLKALVVAPSNDATDILVEKLSQYFPPSEMVRVLAYTRSIDQVPEVVRKYCTNGMEGEQVISKILSATITVSTINMASRLWCTGDGLPKNHFDVICVDEAGHATEPEVIAVASTVMDFQKKQGQLVLAGDPMQLGPIVTSELCQKFKMDRSYMERLVKTSSAYKLEDNDDRYPPGLVTLLVNNYRSHDHILKLPNELFYHNQLIAAGDTFHTHSMTKWEYLPKQGFPILFHAVDGENTREGNSPSWFNPQEAMIVVDYVKKLVEQSKPKVSPEDIGIITPYARQVQKIRTALEVSNINGVKVGSVETFQGQERRVIIISTVRSENSLLQHDLRYNLGFVANEKRFNVAVTRAKALLIVVGNPRVLETDTKNWLHLLKFCKSNDSWLGEEWEARSDDNDEDNETFESMENNDDDDDYETVDKDEWAAVAQEGFCFVNREE